MNKRQEDGLSPVTLLAGELASLRKMFQETARHFTARTEGDIARLRETVLDETGPGKKLEATRIRAARDMITLIRTLDVKPEKGRRRDLKKIETVVEEIQQMIDEW